MPKKIETFKYYLAQSNFSDKKLGMPKNLILIASVFLVKDHINTLRLIAKLVYTLFLI